MGKNLKKLFAAGLSMALLFSFALPDRAVEGKVTPPEPANPVIEAVGDDNVVTWDCVYFGNYYQSNAQDKEPILWRVLSVTEDDMFLLADKVLDCGPYNTTSDPTTWETCSLRGWLNDTFYNTAFTSDEKDAIKTTLVVNDDFSVGGPLVENGNDTLDKVYLLSAQECGNSAYGFWKSFLLDSQWDLMKMGKITQYVLDKGGYSFGEDAAYFTRNTNWWLRGEGLTADQTYKATGIHPAGGGADFDKTIQNFGIRPVLHLDRTKTDVWSYAGTVTSTQEFHEYVPPVEGFEFNGYVLNSKVGGMRGVYTVTDTLNGLDVVESGLIYGVADYAEESDMYVGSSSEYVASFAANADAKCAHNYSQTLTDGTSYRMTLKFAKESVKELTSNWYIRAYVKLEDDSYVYSDVRTYNIYDVITYLYQNKLMPSEAEHNELYTRYLTKVDPNYEVVPYGNTSNN